MMQRRHPRSVLASAVNGRSLSSRKAAVRSLTMIWLAVIALTLAGAYLLGQSVDIEAWLYGLLLVVASVACAYFVRTKTFRAALGGRIDFLEIPVYLSLTGLGLIALFGIAPYIDDTYLLLGTRLPGALPAGLLLSTAGLLAMWLSYAATVGLLKQRLGVRQPPAFLDAPILPRVLALYVGLVVLRIVLYRAGEDTLNALGALKQPVLYLLEVPWLLLAMFGIQSNLNRWPRWLFLAVLAAEMAMTILSGWSSALLKIVFIVMASFSYAGRQIPYKLLLLGVLAAFIFTPLTRSLRGTDLTTPGAVVGSLRESTDEYWGTSNQGVTYNQNLLITRQSGTAQVPGLILRLTPNTIPYRSTAELASIPFSFLPRAVWSSKMESGAKGAEFSVQYLGLSGESAAATTVAGSAYMYGGWFVMLLLMAVAGVTFAFTYYLIAVPALVKGSSGLLALYTGLVIATFHIGEGDIAGMWQGLVQRTVVFYLITVLLCVSVSLRRQRSRR